MAVNAKGLSGGVPLLHPEDLVRFKKLMVPILEAERDAGRRTLLNATFGREAQLTDARIADPDDFFGRFARVVSARQTEAPTRFDTLAPIGSIPEAEQLHVLVRTLAGAGQAQTQRLVVVTLRRSGGDWKVSMAVGLDDLVASLRGGPQPRTGPEGLAQPVADAVPPAPLEPGLPQATRRDIRQTPGTQTGTLTRLWQGSTGRSATWTPARAPLTAGRIPRPLGPSHRHPTHAPSPQALRSELPPRPWDHSPHCRDHSPQAGGLIGGDRPGPRGHHRRAPGGGQPAGRGRTRPRPDSHTRRALPARDRPDHPQRRRPSLRPLRPGCPPGGRLRLVGNLPYNISTPLLFRFLEQTDCIQDMHLMLQKEVVERIAADPGGRDYGRLSVGIQAYCQVDALFTIGPGAFTPAPKVDSAFLRLTPYRPLPHPVADRATLPAWWLRPSPNAARPCATPSRGPCPRGCWSPKGSTPGSGPRRSRSRPISAWPTRLGISRPCPEIDHPAWGLDRRRPRQGVGPTTERTCPKANRPMRVGPPSPSPWPTSNRRSTERGRAPGPGQRRTARAHPPAAGGRTPLLPGPGGPPGDGRQALAIDPDGGRRDRAQDPWRGPGGGREF